MIESGQLNVEDFVTMDPISDAANHLFSTLSTAEDVREAYRGYENSKVGCVRVLARVLVFWTRVVVV